MRRGVKFTPYRLRKWEEDGRGTGTLSTYIPWHRVARTDPASRGRSRLLRWHGNDRACHLLSDVEYEVFLFSTILPGLFDIREQFPLALDARQPAVASYLASAHYDRVPGTLQIAEELGIRHPVVRDLGERAPWVMTTDLLLTFNASSGGTELLAVCVKKNSRLSPRSRDLLRIEREYWRRQGVLWLFVTPDLYERLVANTLRTSAPWALSEIRATDRELEQCAALAEKIHGETITETLTIVRDRLRIDRERAPLVFWQAVWSGQLPIQLKRSRFPSESILVIDKVSFDATNPIVMRRSLCL